MKLKQILKEGAYDIAQILNKDCSKFIQESKRIPLYRGINLKESEEYLDHMIKRSVRKNRRSLGNNKLSIEMFNLFDEKLKNSGFKAIRSNSALCTGNKAIASQYGNNTYAIFPIGDYSYTWNPKVEDYFKDFIYTMTMYQHTKRDIIDNLDEFLNDWWNQIGSKYTNQNLKKAIKSGNEIMITCDQYYGIESGYFKSSLRFVL